MVLPTTSIRSGQSSPTMVQSQRSANISVPAHHSSFIREEHQVVTPYERLIRHLTNDAACQREVVLGKRIGFYKLGEELGAGNFSKVRIAAHVLLRERVAIKIIEKAKLDHKAHKLLAREIQNMEATYHPNIIRLFEVVETLTRLYLVLEYAGGGELYNYVSTKDKLSEDEARPIFAQVLAAVIHMAENVFFAAANWIKLGDFGFSILVKPGETLNTFCGSPPYAAPELFRDERYQGHYVDVWALGILIYFMATGNTPFRGDTVSEMKKRVLAGGFDIPEYVSANCKDLINGCLRMEPETRYGLVRIRVHPWFSTETFPGSYEACSLVPNEEEIDKKPVVKEVWKTLHGYGISKTLLTGSAGKDAKSPVVGMYRIILHRIQSQAYPNPMTGNTMEQTATKEAGKKHQVQQTSRLCVIL